MSTSTQYNPLPNLNEILFKAGASKTVYALVTPEIEATKAEILGNEGDDVRAQYLDQFREAWTAKQDAFHEKFFDTWHEWSKPMVDLDRDQFPFYYPTAGASEAIRQIIFDFAAHGGETIHFFQGEYEGYKAMGEAAGLKIVEHVRDGRDGWHTPFGGRLNRISHNLQEGRDLFFLSQPSAIDGNVWHDYNEFISKFGEWAHNTVVVDLTYVGATQNLGVVFEMNHPAVRNVVFSLSKPFGAYYDRIGGVFARKEDLGLFGNKWFKNLTSIRLGTALMERYHVFFMAEKYKELQRKRALVVARGLCWSGPSSTFDCRLTFTPSDVFILATAAPDMLDEDMAKYLTRAGKIRICLTPSMAWF